MIKYIISVFIFVFFLLPTDVGATAYYVDETAGRTCAGAGTATTTAYCRLDQFTEAARSAGDIVFVRRYIATTTTRGDDLTFTSDGTMVSPIRISADNDNLWNDASTTAQTYTVAVATSTFTASATITGVSPGTWFYVVGDCTQTYNSTIVNECTFFYEVAWVSGNQLGLYMPYKGDQSGAGLSLRLLGANPQWNIATGDFQWIISGDDFWDIRGINALGTDAQGTINVTAASANTYFTDMIVQGNGASDIAFQFNVDVGVILHKIRTFNHFAGIQYTDANIRLYDSYLNCNGATSGVGLRVNTSNVQTKAIVENIVILNCSFTAITGATSADNYSVFQGRNIKFIGNASFISNFINNNFENTAYFEDLNGVIGDNRQTGYINTTQATYSLQSTTTVFGTPRTGGGPLYTEVRPTTNVATSTDATLLKLFDYPIYTDTSSKQYDVYFMSTSTNSFSADPDAGKFWIECEYWAHDTNATSTRKIKKSTGVVDFNGSTAWQALSVTCQPSQTGILYLRGWYGKTKEANMNQFFVDGTPIIQ